jgi:hypothetical protein
LNPFYQIVQFSVSNNGISVVNGDVFDRPIIIAVRYDNIMPLDAIPLEVSPLSFGLWLTWDEGLPVCGRLSPTRRDQGSRTGI